MRRISILMAWGFVCSGLAATVQAQPPHPSGPHPEAKPPATVVARVNVNVETDVDVVHGPADAASETEEHEDDRGDRKPGEKKPELSELVLSILKQGGSGSGMIVIADVNVNVETSVKVRCLSAKSAVVNALESREPKPKATEEQPTPPRKKKKHARKGQKKSAEETSAAAPLQPVESLTSIALNKLKIGDKLELGVSGQLDSGERAQRIADQINLGRNRTLLGMALAGGFLPDQAESLGVVQKAVASLQAQSSGNELSVSVAIPKETPMAIRTLIEAAISQ